MGKFQFIDIELSQRRKHIFRLVQIESFCRQQNKCDSKTEICLCKGGKHCGKRRKCWLPACSPCPTMFSKAFIFRVVKSGDCGVKKLKWVGKKRTKCL